MTNRLTMEGVVPLDTVVIAVDPGREKCGIAVVSKEKGLIEKHVIDTSSLARVAEELSAKHAEVIIVLGDGTAHHEARNTLEKIIVNSRPLHVALINEKHSTEEARSRYWQDNPPKGLWRFFPVTMQVPPTPIDDYVAVILAERYFSLS